MRNVEIVKELIHQKYNQLPIVLLARYATFYRLALSLVVRTTVRSPQLQLTMG
jgi:hypothetical protein